MLTLGEWLEQPEELQRAYSLRAEADIRMAGALALEAEADRLEDLGQLKQLPEDQLLDEIADRLGRMKEAASWRPS